MQHTHVYFVDRDRSGLRADQPLSFLHILYCAKWRIRSWGGAVCLPLQAQVASSVLLRCLQFLFFLARESFTPRLHLGVRECADYATQSTTLPCDQTDVVRPMLQRLEMHLLLCLE